MKKVLLFCGSFFADYDQVIRELIDRNKFSFDVLDIKGKRLNHDERLYLLKEIESSQFDCVVVKCVRDLSLVNELKKLDLNIGTVYFNHRYSYLVNKYQNYHSTPEMIEDRNSSSCDTFFQELLELSILGDYYLNEDSITEGLDRFIEWICGEITLTKIETNMKKSILYNQCDIGRTSCVLTNEQYEELSRGINRPIIDSEKNRLIKEHIINYLCNQFNVETINEKFINRMIDPSFNIHAEVDAILNCDNFITKKIAFVTKKPCYSCFKYMHQSNVKEIYYIYDYKDPITDILFETNEFKASLFSGCINCLDRG